MKNIKFRIVKKQHDCLFLSPKKGVEPVQMSWKEFEENYTVENDVWAIPTEKCLKEMEEVDKLVTEAATAFIISGGLTEKGINFENLGSITLLGENVDKICEKLGCTMAEALQMIRVHIDKIVNFGKTNKSPKKHKKFNKRDNKKPQEKSVPEGNTYQILNDNPQLLALKEKFNKK